MARRPLALAALLAALAGCSGGSSGGPDCSDRATRQDIQTLAATWYLFAGQVDFGAFDPADPAWTPAAFLDAIVNSAGGPDAGRHYSYLSTKASNQQFYDEGTSLGFGMGLHREGASRLLLSQVFGEAMAPGTPLRSPAAQAGFTRGDELLAIAPTQAALDDAASQVADLLARDATAPGTLSAAFSSSVAGTTRWFRVAPRGGGAAVDRQATTAIYSLDPVPPVAVLTSPGGRKVGYVLLRTFINPATPLLRDAFALFKAQDPPVTDLVVDLRYDGGGLLDVAKTFLDLMEDGRAGAVAYGLRHNAARAAQYDVTRAVAAEASAIAPARVAVITGPATASASELLPFSLVPWKGADVAVVGDRSLGKPAGQYGFSAPDCPTVYVLLSFQLANAAGRAEYWDGLPDAAWAGSSCAAADDLTRPLGDPEEASTKAALAFIDGGQAACTPIPPFAPLVRRARALAGEGAAVEPTLAQRHVPNLF